MNTPKSLLSRHPKVMMLYQHDLESGAASIISDHLDDFRAVKIGKKAIEALSELKPKIILLETDSVHDSLKLYLSLIKNHELLQYPHRVILLCSNKEAALAYSMCAQGIFYDYFIDKPIYEKYRLKSILNNLMTMFYSHDDTFEEREKCFDGLDKEISGLVEEFSAVKTNLQTSIEECKASIAQNENENAADSAQSPTAASDTDEQAPSDAAANKTESLALLLKPIVAQIETDIHQTLNQLISDLVTQKHKQNIDKMQIGEALNRLPNKNMIEDALKKMTKAKAAKQSQDNQHHLNDPSAPADKQTNTNIEDVASAELGEKPKHAILLVEDNQIYRDVIKKILLEQNYIVKEACNGIEAIRFIKKQKFDLALMDLFMPQLDGLNVTKHFRTISGKDDLPIIALTGNKNKELVKKWVSFGINGYIMKPSSREQIIEVVKKALAKKDKAELNKQNVKEEPNT